MRICVESPRLSAGVVLCVMIAAVSRGAELPAPLVELCFDDGLANSGTAGGGATLSVYAEGDAPVLAAGAWGRCLDMSQSSRFGGTLADTDPAGSALFYSNAALDQLNGFTITFWMQGPAGERGIASRIMTKFTSWEIMYADGVAALYATESKGKRHYGAPRPPCDRRGLWTFIAVTVDATAGKVGLAVGGTKDGLGETARHDLVEPTPHVATALQIGNFEGIRPLKGLLDNVRIYAQALTDEQVCARFETDLGERTPPERVHSRGVITPGKRAFRPKLSAIPFSSRWQRRGERKDDLFGLLKAYHATHMLWVYGTRTDFVREVKDLGMFYEGTLTGMYGASKSGEEPDATQDSTGRAWSFDGQKFVPSHMEQWPKRWHHWRGCHNSPDFRKGFWEGADTLVTIGCDAIHVDAWEMVVATASTGRGCFCPHCMKRFRDYLEGARSTHELRELGVDDVETFDYREYLRTRHGITNADECRAKYRAIFKEDPLALHFLSAQRGGLRDFYTQLRKHLDEVSPGKYVSVSVNNQFYRRSADRRFRGYYCTDVVDFFIGEVSQSMQTANHFVHCCKLAEGFGAPQVMMSKPRVVAKAQAAQATTYALGSWMRVPWDVYMDNDPKTRQPAPRYFGRLEDWGPLYDFVHEHAHLFDGHHSAASVAVVINADMDNFTPVWSLMGRLARAQIQFRVVPASAEYNRIPLSADTLLKFGHLIVLSPEESFCEDDRQVLTSVRESLRVRFLSPDADIGSALTHAGQKLLHVEAPQDVYAFLRVKPNSAVVHLVNWNTTPGGAADALGYVTLQLLRPARWGESLQVNYYRPDRPASVHLEPEPHAGMIRITVPKLETWGVVEIVPSRDTE